MEIETNLIRSGNGFAFQIPKALVRCKILEHRKSYKLTVIPVDELGRSVAGYYDARSISHGVAYA